MGCSHPLHAGLPSWLCLNVQPVSEAPTLPSGAVLRCVALRYKCSTRLTMQ